MKTTRRRPGDYPALPQVLDAETLLLLGTFEPHEQRFVRQHTQPRLRYLTGLYLKALSHLGHSHVQPEQLPRQLRQRLVDHFHLEQTLVELKCVGRSTKSRVVAEVRQFLGYRAADKRDKKAIEDWLASDVAYKEARLDVVTQSAIERFGVLKLELPPADELQNLVRRAAEAADAVVLLRLGEHIGKEDGQRLDALVAAGHSPSWLERFKAAAPEASAANVGRELDRIERLRGFVPRSEVPAEVSRCRMQQLGRLARQYNAAELRQMKTAHRRAMLYCYATERYRQLLDALVDQYLRVWEQTKATAANYANGEQIAWAATYEQHQQTLEELLGIIIDNPTQFDLWRAIEQFKSNHELPALHAELQTSRSWNSFYVDKLEDHYAALRRFLPQLYRLLPLAATTTDDTLLEAWRFVEQHAHPGETTLPAKGCPTAFLPPLWRGRALRRQRRNGQLVRVLKVPYELGLVEASTKALKEGSVAVPGAQRYAPLNDHLLDRDTFLANYAHHAESLGYPTEASSYYGPLRQKLDESLRKFDEHYEEHRKTFWVHRNGTLGFSRVRGECIGKRAERLRERIASSLPEVSVLDILLDCHRWTGFLELFRPASTKRNGASREWLMPVLSALYAYGCYCGPTQAARALGLSKDQVQYTWRRHMPVDTLKEAARMLSEAYERTPMALRLADPGVLLTDSMQLRTLKASLIARRHHRYRDGKSTLLYQHVSADLICQFTQATLCNVSEGIKMLAGARQCRKGNERLANICDSAGKSHRAYGMGDMLSIDLYARLRSHNVKLWAAEANAKYDNIADALAGTVDWQRIETGWRDMVWIMASVEAGVAKPDIIFERLMSQPNHPADRGFVELGKALQSNYALRYGMEMELRRYVIPYTSRREHWNKFTREVRAFGDTIREKSLENQDEVFWCLTVIQNAIVLWNSLAIEQVIANSADISADDPNLAHIWPTMTRHSNFVGHFNLDLRRRPPFRMRMAS
jgi:TnpA family transposase